MGVNLKCGSLVCLVLIFQSLISFSYAHAGPTVYTYDSLRRVTKATYPNGISVSYQYDNAGNIINAVSSGMIAPPSGNYPPVANNDNLTLKSCSAKSLNVVANDTDPDNNYPISLLSAQSSSTSLKVKIINSTTLDIESVRYISTSVTITYSIQDSLGAQATGKVSVQLTSGACK